MVVGAAVRSLQLSGPDFQDYREQTTLFEGMAGAMALEGSRLRLGYLLAESHWGRGFASELLRGFVAWARTGPYRRIVAGVSPENAASRRVLEKCGFAQLPQAEASEDFYVLDVTA